jgi:hypothetical protein
VPFPDVDDLNAAIPESEWELGVDGKPRKPWQKQLLVFLIDVKTCAVFTFATSTTGGSMAFENLGEAIKWRRALREANSVPIVALASAPMPTKFGMKRRPHFKIEGWHEVPVASPAQLDPTVTAPSAQLVEHKAEDQAATTSEPQRADDIDDEILY